MKQKQQQQKFFLFLIIFQIFSFFLFAREKEESILNARVLYERLTGVPILGQDHRLLEMAQLIAQEDWNGAAHIASEDDHFFNVILRDWAALMSNRKGSPYVDLNDFTAMVIGVARDGIDARKLLTGNFRYEANAKLGIISPSSSSHVHYQELEKKKINLRRELIQHVPQWDDIEEAAGLLTTYTWASEHLVAGTNRRATEFSFQEFLCKPILKWKDFGLPDLRVRRDVPRNPSGDPTKYQNECRSCHAPLDGLTGAFSNFDFNESGILYGRNWIAPKMNQNNHVFAKGFKVEDSSWINLATSHHNEAMGWRTKTEGVGINAFGVMLSESQAFSRCMVTRTVRHLCRQEPENDDLVNTMALEFEKNQYQLRSLFERVAIACIKGKI